MEKITNKINESIKKLGLKCTASGASGQKLSFVELSGEENVFNLYISYRDKIIIEKFEGCINIDDFIEIIKGINTELKKHNL